MWSLNFCRFCFEVTVCLVVCFFIIWQCVFFLYNFFCRSENKQLVSRMGLLRIPRISVTHICPAPMWAFSIINYPVKFVIWLTKSWKREGLQVVIILNGHTEALLGVLYITKVQLTSRKLLTKVNKKLPYCHKNVNPATIISTQRLLFVYMCFGGRQSGVWRSQNA